MSIKSLEDLLTRTQGWNVGTFHYYVKSPYPVSSSCLNCSQWGDERDPRMDRISCQTGAQTVHQTPYLNVFTVGETAWQEGRKWGWAKGTVSVCQFCVIMYELNFRFQLQPQHMQHPCATRRWFGASGHFDSETGDVGYKHICSKRLYLTFFSCISIIIQTMCNTSRAS